MAAESNISAGTAKNAASCRQVAADVHERDLFAVEVSEQLIGIGEQWGLLVRCRSVPVNGPRGLVRYRRCRRYGGGVAGKYPYCFRLVTGWLSRNSGVCPPHLTTVSGP